MLNEFFVLVNHQSTLFFATELVRGLTTGIKREVRCKSGAIPVAVKPVSSQL